jgi:hypothetical protein
MNPGIHMSLSDLASIGSFVSGIAVLVSLIYLAQQMRQNTRHTRALIFQGSAALAFNQFRAMAEPELAAATIIANGGTPTQEEIKRFQFRQVCSLYAVVWDDFVAQHDEGLVNAAHFQRIRVAMVQQMRENPAIRESFKQMISQPGAPDRGLHDFVRAVIGDAEKLPALGG